MDTNIYASSVDLFNKLGRISIDDIIAMTKLYIVFNIIHGTCPDYFDHNICYVNTRINYETRASTNVILKFVSFLIPRLVNVFLQVAPALWNDLASRNIRGLSTVAKFKNESEKHFSFVILKMTILLLAELLNF